MLVNERAQLQKPVHTKNRIVFYAMLSCTLSILSARDRRDNIKNCKHDRPVFIFGSAKQKSLRFFAVLSHNKNKEIINRLKIHYTQPYAFVCE